MIKMSSKHLILTIEDNASKIQVFDSLQNQNWILDEKSLLCVREDKGENELLIPMGAKSLSDNKVEVAYKCADKRITILYSLADDHLEATLLAEKSDDVAQVALPGSFESAGGGRKYLLPIMQGMLWDTRGEPFEEKYRESKHTGFSMTMFGCIGQNGALLCIAETSADCLWWIGKDSDNRTWATNLQTASLGTIGYERVVRLYFTKPTITAVAKRYRERVIEKGRFKSWQEKIKERPALERLFGATMCFIGYCQDDLDYVEECRKLKDMGVDRALIYPVRHNTYSKDFLMGGFKPIDLDREQVKAIKDLGFDVAPWTWINASIENKSTDNSENYRRDASGNPIKSWQIDDQTWYEMCSGSLPDYKKHANETDFDDMTWDHFDVITSEAHGVCYAADHKSHPGKPLDKTQDREFLRKLLLVGQAGSRAVSSESFNDAYSLEYDMGCAKAWPQFGSWQYWPIPLTMLVYHDSMLHTWWEIHNYNNPHHGRNWNKYQYGGGRPRIMSTMDALYGCIPDVFPFGAQYGWVDKERGNTYLYKYRLEDPETQYTLRFAKPVAKLHKEIGMLEMTDFQFLSEDGYLQKTEFSDGTQVYANFLNELSPYLEGVGHMQPESWIVVRK